MICYYVCTKHEKISFYEKLIFFRTWYLLVLKNIIWLGQLYIKKDNSGNIEYQTHNTYRKISNWAKQLYYDMPREIINVYLKTSYVNFVKHAPKVNLILYLFLRFAFYTAKCANQIAEIYFDSKLFSIIGTVVSKILL